MFLAVDQPVGSLSAYRPISGITNVCQLGIDTLALSSNAALQSTVDTMTHEILHALGFTSALYPYYMDASGNPRGNSAFSNTDSKVALLTPKVVQAAKDHFTCSSLTSAAIEDNGGSGTAGSHWEYSQFMGDVMCGSLPSSRHGKKSQLSSMTMAWAEDTGWYVPVYENQGYREWGKGAGCSVVTRDCASAAPVDSSGKFFCPAASVDGAMKCTNYRSPTQCVSETTGSLAPSCNLWRADGYYSNPSNPDLCSALLPTAKGWSGFGAADAYYTAAGFRFAQNSRCIDLDTALTSGGATLPTRYACYPMSCTAGALTVTVNSANVACPFGTTVDLAGKGGLTSGKIICPDAGICDTLGCGAACELHGECYKAKCYRDIGWDGADCSTQLVSALSAAPAPAAAAAGGASLKIKASFTAGSLSELTAQEGDIKAAMAKWLGVGASDITIEWASARRRLLATFAMMATVSGSAAALASAASAAGASGGSAAFLTALAALGLTIVPGSLQVAYISGVAASSATLTIILACAIGGGGLLLLGGGAYAWWRRRRGQERVAAAGGADAAANDKPQPAVPPPAEQGQPSEKVKKPRAEKSGLGTGRGGYG